MTESGRRRLLILLAGICLLSLTACLGSFQDRYIRQFDQVIRNYDDPQLVTQALPAYLLALEALVAESPDNPRWRNLAAQLYTTYSLVFVTEPDRRLRLAQQGLSHAEVLLCAGGMDCGEITRPGALPDQELLGDFAPETLYRYATAEAAVIDATRAAAVSGSLEHVPAVLSILSYLSETEPAMDSGNVLVFLGVMLAAQPFGDAQQRAVDYLHQADRAADGRNLLAQLVLATRLADPIDRQGLKTIVAATPEQPGLTLQNRIAQARAAALLSEPESG